MKIDLECRGLCVTETKWCKANLSPAQRAPRQCRITTAWDNDKKHQEFDLQEACQGGGGGGGGGIICQEASAQEAADQFLYSESIAQAVPWSNGHSHHQGRVSCAQVSCVHAISHAVSSTSTSTSTSTSRSF